MSPIQKCSTRFFPSPAGPRERLWIVNFFRERRRYVVNEKRAFIVLHYFSAGFRICNKFQGCRLRAQPVSKASVIYGRINPSVHIPWLWNARNAGAAGAEAAATGAPSMLPPGRNDRNSPAVPARLEFPGMASADCPTQLIKALPGRHIPHLTVRAGMFNNNCSLPSCQGSPGSSWLGAPGLGKMQSTCVPPPPAAAASPPPAREPQNGGKWKERLTKNEGPILQKSQGEYVWHAINS